TPTVTSDSGEYVTYSVFTVDPSIAALAHTSGWVAGQPTSANMVTAANALNTVFPDVPNNNDCPWIADAVAAAAGAPMAMPTAVLDPSLNVEGGFWRIAYSGVPQQDWSSLVQEGDVIRMAWFHPESPSDISGHTTTALGSAFTSSGTTVIE